MKCYRWLFLLTLFLADCQTSLITDLTVPSGGILYKDDFSNPASGWPRVVDINGSEDYINGSYLILVNTPQYNLWAVPGRIFNDVRVEVDATPLAGPEANRIGIVCRHRNPQNYYFFIISSDGYYAIGKTLNGTASLLGQDMMAYNTAIVQGKGSNHIRFDCIGASLTGYVNDQMLAGTNDADFQNGDAGLLVGTFDTAGVVIVFTNFRVIKP